MLRDGRRTITRSAEDHTDISFGLRFLERSTQEGRCSRRQFRPLRFHHGHVENRAHNLLVPGSGADDYHFESSGDSCRSAPFFFALGFTIGGPSQYHVPRSRYHAWCSQPSNIHDGFETNANRSTTSWSFTTSGRFLPDSVLPSGLLRPFQLSINADDLGCHCQGGVQSRHATTLNVSPNTQSGLSFCFWGCSIWRPSL